MPNLAKDLTKFIETDAEHTKNKIALDKIVKVLSGNDSLDIQSALDKMNPHLSPTPASNPAEGDQGEPVNLTPPEAIKPINPIVQQGATMTPVRSPLTPNEVAGSTVPEIGVSPSGNVTRFGRDFGVSLPTSPMAQSKNMDELQANKWNTQEQFMYGTPEQRAEAAFELQTPKVGSSARVLLTPEELKVAVERVKANPALLVAYPIYQKSQISNAISGLATPQQYGKTQEAQSGQIRTTKTLNLIEKAFNETLPAEGQIETWFKAPEKYAAQLGKFNSEVVAYQGLVNGAIGNLARNLFGEKGVLTDYDVQRVKQALPDARNTSKEIAKKQFDYLKELNSQIAQGTISVYGNKDDFIDDITNDLNTINNAHKTPSPAGSTSTGGTDTTIIGGITFKKNASGKWE